MSAVTTELNLLGGFSLSVDGERRAVAARKVMALLCRLAVREATLPRDQLAALLWPDSAPGAARHSLRQALSELRRVLDGSGLALTVTSQEVALHPELALIDARDFVSLAGSRDVADRERGMALYRGALLEGLEVRLDTFDGWLDDARAELAQTAIGVCRSLAEHYDDDLERAIGWQKRLLGLDPLDEAAHRELMRLHIVAGQDGAAIRQYLHCRSVLERELDIQPEAETTALYEGLLTHRAGAPAARPSPAAMPPAAADPAPSRRLRPAVVAALQVDVDEADPERADAVWRERQQALTRVLRSYGGRVVAQVGRQVVCGFGLDRVRGTEADRACLAAAELAGAVPGLRAGIASGQVIFHPEDGSLVGQATSDAQKLCTRAASGEVLLGDAVAAAQRTSGRAEPVEPGTLRLVAGDVAQDGAPLVGRNLEIRQFVAVLDASRDGGYGCALLIRGEAGIGKTRLLQEYGSLARQEGFAVHTGQVYDFGNARGQDATAQLLRSLLGEAEPGAALIAARVGIEHVPFIQALLDADADPAALEQLAGLSPQERLDRSSDAVAALVRAAARDSALLLAVEDLHWAERLTLMVLPRLAEVASELPVVVVMTSRVAGEALDPEWRAAMGGAPLLTLDLQPLRQGDAGRLASVLGASDDELAGLLARAGGNPLFIQQLVRGCRLDGAVPLSIQGVAVAQLEALPEAVQSGVRAASVLGQHFALEALGALVDGEPQLADAIDVGLIHRAEGAWCFHHALLRDGIYENVLPSERRALHARAAAYYRTHSLSLWAQHLDLADSDDAVAALLQAAEDEIEHYRLSRARTLVARARERDPGEARAMLIDAQLELMLGNTSRAAAGFHACREAAGLADVAARALVGLGMALNQLDDFGGAVDALREAVRLNEDDHAFQADAWLQLGNALFPQGLTEGCREAHETSLQHAEQARSTLRQARAEGGLGDAYYQHGAMLTAFRHFDRCVTLGETHQHPSVVPANQAMRSLTLMYQNRFAEALADGRRALERAEASSNLRHQLLAHNVLGSIESFHGDVDAGLVHALRTVDLGQRIGSRRFVIDGLAQIAHLLWSAGRIDDAREALTEVLHNLTASLMPFAGAYVRGLQALCARSDDERRAHLRTGARLLGNNAVSHCHVYFYAAAIEACHAAGEVRQALEYADALSAYTAAEPLPFADFFVRIARSRTSAGDRDDRQALLGEARGLEFGAAVRLLTG